MAVKVAVIYSATGTTYKLTCVVEERTWEAKAAGRKNV